MFVSILMNTINIIGNYIGVFVLHMGVAGVAWPTLISRAVAAVLMLGLSFSKENPIYIVWNEIFCWRGMMLKKILTVAVPNGIENALFQVGKILLSTFVATYGTTQIAANGVSNSLNTLCYATESAIQLGAVTIIGQCVGADDYPQAEYYIRRLVKIAYAAALVNNVIMYLRMPFLLGLYTLSGETYQIAHLIITMECIAVTLLHSPAFVIPSSLRAAGDVRYTMIISVLSMFVFRVAGAYILGTIMGYGVVGTKFAWYIDWAARCIFFIHRFHSGKWKKFRLVG